MTSFTDEDALQGLVAESPELLGSSEPVAVVRELTIPQVGSVDLVAVSAAGQVTLVECKLAANPEIRRSVVGQVFAYAAGLWRLSYDEFDLLFAARAGGSLAETVMNAANLEDDWDQDAFRQAVAENLETGRFDLVIAVDSITDELERAVRYLNEQTSEIRVLALELDHVADGDFEVLVPTVYGKESATRKPRSSARHVWDEESLFSALDESCPEGVPVIRHLYDQAVGLGGKFSWGGGGVPILTVSLTVGTIRTPVWRCNTRPPARWVVVFDLMQRRGVALERMQRFRNRLREIPGVTEWLEGVEEAGWRKRSRIPISPFLTAPGEADKVVSALEEFLDSELP